MASVFPSYAKLQFSGYTQRPASGVFRTDMESGPPKQLKKQTMVMIERSVTYFFDTKADFLSFIAWVKNDINLGTDWFDWTDPVDGLVKSARIKEGLVEYSPIAQILSDWHSNFIIETWS